MTTGTSPEETTGPADLRLVPPACAAWGAAHPQVRVIDP